MDILSIKGLYKSFGDRQVLCGVDLCVPEHSIFGFVGTNGAGKTTAMKTVLGLLRADSGEIYVAGERVRFGQTPTNRHVGYLPDVPEFYSFMTPREYLTLCAECAGLNKDEISQRCEELLALVGLADEKHRIKGFSRGMKQRLGIAQALISRPTLLICDEPTSALDPIGRREILDVLVSVREQTTVLFSTHILSDVERICTDVAFLHGGRIALQGSLDEVRKSACSDAFSVELSDANDLPILTGAFDNVISADGGTATFSGDEAQMYKALDLLRASNVSVRRVERTGASLETLFMEVVSK